MEVKPTYFPSVPRIFEKIYAMAVGERARPGAAAAGGRARDEGAPRCRSAARRCRRSSRRPSTRPTRQLYSNVRDLFGGNIKQAVTGAAPIAQEILEFFYACGVLVLEGWGMTETSTAATINRRDDFKFGSVGQAVPGVEVKIAEDGEILVRGPNIFRGYYKNEDATDETIVDGWLHTGDIGRIDEDGFVYITGRKKDIIITAGGKNITPANLENWLKQNQYISQAVVYGDRRPYLTVLITLDPEEIVPWAEKQGLADRHRASSPRPTRCGRWSRRRSTQVNSRVGPVEQLKYFTILRTTSPRRRAS